MAPDRLPDPLGVALEVAAILERLDWERLAAWAPRLGVGDLLEQVRREA